ncbi:MAG TPA: DUF4105 domain-containing protein [Spirochaetota bacterium]|nr:DUF4105 domain-containing protein [Spirochaetota bacterium]
MPANTHFLPIWKTERYGICKNSVSFFIVLLCIFIPLNIAWGDEDQSRTSYISSLIHEADSKKLYDDRYWHVLLHYKGNCFGTKSLIDDPRFFLAEKGKYDPKAELHATIRAFFEPEKPGEKHPVCRFIARYHWLKEHLAIDPGKLPVPVCEEYNKIIDEVRPETANVIFPTSHINSPASMFGHTFLTVDTANKNKLLSYAVNYSALTRETFGPLYAFKGVFGLYKGYFSIQPYYEKIREYNDYNQRDIWEYRLNLTKDEVKRMMWHILELDQIYSDYYFFDENCSYNLLFTLDVARSSLNLTDTFYSWIPSWVIPVDTVRSVRESGALEKVYYRPSQVTRIKHMISLLNRSEQNLALSIADDSRKPDVILSSDLSPEKKIIISDLVMEFTKYQYSQEDITKQDYTERFLGMMRVRSSLGSPDMSSYEIPEPGNPEEGHRSSRISLGAGIKDGSVYQQFQYRPAYHTLLDPEKGYVPGGQIVFGNFAFRFYDEERDFRMERFDVIDILSLAPRDRFLRSMSWKVNTGFRRELFPGEREYLAYGVNSGGGVAFENSVIGLVYLMVEPDILVSRSFDPNYSLGVGGTLGILKNLAEWWKIHLSVKELYYGAGEKRNLVKGELAQRFSFTINTGVVIGASRSLVSDEDFKEGYYVDELYCEGNLFF